MDLAAVATQLAVRFGPTAITPPTGYDDVALSTHLLPQAIGTTPTVIVFPPDITYNYPTANRTGDATFPVRFYIAQTGDLSAATTAVYAWYSVLVDQLVGNVQLGQSSTGVTHALVMGSRIGHLTYADTEYLGIEFAVVVHLVESLTFTA